MINFNCSAQEVNLLNFESGIGIEYNTLFPTTTNQDVNYFSSNYTNGVCSTVLYRNRLYIKNWHLSTGIGLSFINQKQFIVFSNNIDHIIDFKVTHKMYQWQVNLGCGRSFNIRKSSNLNLELGIMAYGFLKNAKPSADLHGNFHSDYISINDYGKEQSSTATYNYVINYQGHTNISPSIKLGILNDLKKGRFELGFNYTWQRVDYENFIVIKSNNYNAISSSMSESSMFGIYCNYFFSKNNSH